MSDRQKISRKKGTASNSSNPSLAPKIQSLATPVHDSASESHQTIPKTAQPETSQEFEKAAEEQENQENISLKESSRGNFNILERAAIFRPQETIQRQELLEEKQEQSEVVQRKLIAEELEDKQEEELSPLSKAFQFQGNEENKLDKPIESFNYLENISITRPKQNVQRQKLLEDKQEQSEVVQKKLNFSESEDKQEELSPLSKAFQIQGNEKNKLDKPIESFNYLERASIFRPKKTAQYQDLDKGKQKKQDNQSIPTNLTDSEIPYNQAYQQQTPSPLEKAQKAPLKSNKQIAQDSQNQEPQTSEKVNKSPVENSSQSPTEAPIETTATNVAQTPPTTAGGSNRAAIDGGQEIVPTPQKAAPISAQNPAQILEQIKNTSPTQAFATYNQAETASAEALENQRQQLQATIPEIPAPTGLSPQTAGVVTNKSIPAFPVATNIQPIHSGYFNSRGFKSNSGKHPKVNLTGEANPSRMNGEQAQSLRQVQAAKNKAAGNINRNFGENNIFPKTSNQTLKANKQLSPVAPPSSKGGEPPTIAGEVVGGLNEGLTPYYQAKITPEQEKYVAGKQKFDVDSINAKQDANKEIKNLNQETTNKQIDAKKLAQQEVAQAKQNWKEELDTVEKDYQQKAGKATKEQRRKVEQEKAKGETKANQHLKEAEQKAEAEKKKAAKEEARKKEEAERKKKKQNKGGFFSRLWSGIKSAFNSIVEGLKKAVNFIYDKLRKAVKFIFEAAKKLAMAAIDLARNIIVGIIKVLGEILKGLVQVVFAAFPEISKKFTNAIDSAVNKATEIVNSAADFLQKAVSTVLDFLANTLDTLLGLVQSLYNGIFTVIGMLIRGEFAELIKGFGNLIEGAKAMPPQFETAALEELMGDDLDQPLSPEVIAQAQQAGIAIPGMTGENTPPINQTSEMPSPPWSEENVGVDAVENNMELSPELIAELMQQTQGDGEVTLAESQDKSRSMESIVSEAGGQQQAVGKQEPQIPDDGLSPRQRAGIKWELMKQGIKQWFSDNWPILLAGFIAAAAVIIAAIVATGGAVLAALPAIMQVLAVVFAAELIAMIGGHMRDYMSKAWEGDIQGGGKSLAKALAAGAIELVFELIPVLGKAIKKGVRAVGKGAKAVFKGGAKLATRAGKAVAKGAKYTIQKGKVLFKGIAGTKFGKQFKSLSNLGQGLLDRMRFKAFRIKVKNRRFSLEGLVNPWVVIAEGNIRIFEEATEGAVEVTEEALKKLNTFMEQRKALTDTQAIQFFDEKYKKVVGDASNPKKIDVFERYLDAKKKQGNGDLEKGLLEDYKKANKPPEVKPPFGEGADKLPDVRREYKELIEEIDNWLKDNPANKEEVSRLIKTLEGDLNGKKMQKMENGLSEIKEVHIQGYRNNIKGIKSEFEQAKKAPSGTKIGVYIKFDAKKIEIDQIRPDGTWVNVKNYELFETGSGKFDELKKQAEMNLRAAKANPLPNGEPPTILFDFGETGVTPEVADALRAIELDGHHVQVTGKEIFRSLPVPTSAPAPAPK